MSTTFYGIRPPVTSIRVTKDADPKYSVASFFVNHQLSGELLLASDEVAEFLLIFRGLPYVHRTAGPNGPRYEAINAIPRDTAQVIDEYGALVEAFELRKEIAAAAKNDRKVGNEQ